MKIIEISKTTLNNSITNNENKYYNTVGRKKAVDLVLGKKTILRKLHDLGFYILKRSYGNGEYYLRISLRIIHIECHKKLHNKCIRIYNNKFSKTFIF